MRIVRHLHPSPLRLSVLIGLVCLAVLGFIAKSGTTKQSDIFLQRSKLLRDLDVDHLTVQNQTSGFTVISVQKTPEGYIKITLRNDYPKTIVAYQLSVGSTTTLVDSFTNGIKPGIESGELRERIEPIDVDPELFRRGIIVRAVVFNDATADGDPQFVQQIDDFRLGEMLQTKQFLSSLSNIREAFGRETLSQLEEAKLTMLNLEEDKRFSADVMSGLRNMRLLFSRDIDEIVNANDKDRTDVMRMAVDRYQSKFNDIRDYNEKARQRQIRQER